MNFHADFDLNYHLLNSDLYAQHNVSVFVVRSDQVHGQVSGNKWFKLKHSLLHAIEKNIGQVVSFGGAYSNHIHALAFAANSLGLQSVGFIRGEWTDDNQTLNDAKAWGMQLISLSREEYRLKNDVGFLNELKKQFPQALWVPEGGSNSAALQGVIELMGLIEQQLPDLDMLVAACGTGGTLAGLIAGANSTRAILGVPVLKGAGFLKQDIERLLADADLDPGCTWELDLDGHYGGYGKVKAEHKMHMRQLEAQHDILLEPVYTAKMWRRFDELVVSGHFAWGAKVALLHSGGLQGRRGFSL
jgi:1-aminocyclopropane-1-carboxylate deaminase